MLVVLFVVTLHPGVWRHRRHELRLREARLKKENDLVRAERERQDARDAASSRGEGDESGEIVTPTATTPFVVPQRPSWLRDYIQRVERAEWVDG